MLEKYIRLYPHFFPCAFPEETKRLIPSYHDHEAIINVSKKLEEFQIISKWLQSESGSITINGEVIQISVNHFNIRSSFDSLIARFPCMERHLSKNADIVHSPDFENAVTKLQGKINFSRFTSSEKRAITFYVSIEDTDEPDTEVSETFQSLLAMVASQAEAEGRSNAVV